MANSAPVKRAFQRSQVLAKIVAELKGQAHRNPLSEKWVDYGITEPDDSRKSADLKLTQLFEEISGLIEHLTILDMAASYELAARTRFANYIGIIQGAGESLARTNSIPRYSLGVIKGAQSYDGISAINDLLKPSVDPALIAELTKISKARNRFAHGTSVKLAPEVDRAEAKEILIHALDAI